MVVFTCQCGESLRKPKVVKHRQISPRCTYLTCVDCQKVFVGEEYQSHVKCISEEQRYMGKLFDASGKSGKVEGAKQDRWQAAVVQALETYQGPLRSLCTRLAGFANIPRKQKPFANFVKNSLRLTDSARINQLWEVVSSGTTATNAASGSSEEETNNTVDTPSKCGQCATHGGTKRWRGWVDEAESLLSAKKAKCLPWKALQQQLVDKYFKVGGFHDEDGQQKPSRRIANLRALASLPDAMLSADSNKVTAVSGSA